MELGKHLEDWKEGVKAATGAAHELGRKICVLLRPVIPDLSYTIGWAEAGVDTLCFWSEERRGYEIFTKGDLTKYTRLANVIEEAMGVGPDSAVEIDTPFGVYITHEEAERVKGILKENL